MWEIAAFLAPKLQLIDYYWVLESWSDKKRDFFLQFTYFYRPND